MFLVIILLLVGGYYFFHQSGNPGTNHNVSNAEEVLKQRFVSGEIDEDTYNRMLKIIRS